MEVEDDTFFQRADSHIHLSNQQISDIVSRGKVSASMMYSTARFNAWLSACSQQNGDEMAENKQDTIEYFVAEYRTMLEENLDDYIKNYVAYMSVDK